MGVDIALYRCRIGTFSMPRKCRNRFSGHTVSVVLRLFVCLSMLVVMGGDVELNPGPPKSQRQKTLSFVETADQSGDRRRTSVGDGRTGQNSDELMTFLREMRTEVRTDLASINSKIDDINRTVNILKSENESLRNENKQIRQDMSVLTSKLDRLEGYSRRNNLRIHGIEGSVGEDWHECERKVRTFIRDDLGLPSHEQVEIERAHRIGGRGRTNSSIIVKFSKYKDREAILNKGKQVFDRDSQYSVQEDYTDRVRLHRRELGKRLAEARDQGQYAVLRYDKLIIDNDVYKYDDTCDQIVLLGATRGRAGSRPRFGGARAHSERRETRASQSATVGTGDVARSVGSSVEQGDVE